MSVNYSSRKRLPEDTNNNLEENIDNPNEINQDHDLQDNNIINNEQITNNDEQINQKKLNINITLKDDNNNQNQNNINTENNNENELANEQSKLSNENKNTENITKENESFEKKMNINVVKKMEEENKDINKEDNNEIKNFSNKIKNKNNNLENRENRYKSQISSLEEKIKEIQINHKNDLLKLINMGKTKDVDLKSLSKENNTLKNNLEAISVKLDEMIYKSTNNPRKIIKNRILNENKIKEPNYEQQIMIKNKEVKNKQQLIDILNKDKIKLQNSLKLLDNTDNGGGNKIKNQLKDTNLEIIELENKIKNYKLIISEHAQCVKKIYYLNKMIGSKKREIVATKLEINEKDTKTNELTSKINMVDKALEILEENKHKKKLKLKQKDYQLSLENEYNQTEQQQIVRSSRIQSQKYVKTIPSNSKAIKNKILKNNINIRKNASPSSSRNNILHSYTAEEVKKALNVFTEQERQAIMKMMNNNQERYETLIEKLVVLERFRNAQEKQIKVKIRRNKNKIEKDIESLNSVKNENTDNEQRKNELIELIKQCDEEYNEIKKRINELNNDIKGVKKNKVQNKNINTEGTKADTNNNLNTEVDMNNKMIDEKDKADHLLCHNFLKHGHH